MTDKIKMIATDTIHISALSPDPFFAGDTFEAANETDAKHYERLGHKRAKMAAPVQNKAEPAPANKSKAKGE